MSRLAATLLHLITGWAALSLGCSPPEQASEVSEQQSALLATLSVGGSVTMDAERDLAALHLLPDQRVYLHVEQVHPPLSPKPQLQIRLLSYVHAPGHLVGSAGQEIYLHNGPTAQDIQVQIKSSGQAVGGTVLVTARSTRCDDTCNDNRTSFCEETTGTCGGCKSGAGSGSTTAVCPDGFPICGPDGACKSCNGDYGSNSTDACPLSRAHCDPYGFGYGSACREYSDSLDFTPPPPLRNREIALPLQCTWKGVPISETITARLVLGPSFLEPTQNGSDWRPSAYLRDILISGYSAIALDNQTALRKAVLPSWPWREFSALIDVVYYCGPSATPESLWPQRNYAPATTPTRVGTSVLDTSCTYTVVGSRVDVAFGESPLTCQGSAI